MLGLVPPTPPPSADDTVPTAIGKRACGEEEGEWIVVLMPLTCHLLTSW